MPGPCFPEAVLEYLAIACRVLVGTVFVTSAASKLNGRASFDAFARSTERMAGRAGGRATAIAVVAMEGAIPILLAVHVAAAAGLLLAAALLGAFTVAIARALRRGAATPCRCFGRSERPMGRRHLVRNGLLIVASLAGAAGAVAADGALQAGGVAIAAGAGLLSALIVVLLDDVVDLFTTMPEARGTRI